MGVYFKRHWIKSIKNKILNNLEWFFKGSQRAYRDFFIKKSCKTLLQKKDVTEEKTLITKCCKMNCNNCRSLKDDKRRNK